MAAGRWSCVLVFLTISLVSLSVSSPVHVNEEEYNNYEVYSGKALEGLALEPLLRIVRDANKERPEASFKQDYMQRDDPDSDDVKFSPADAFDTTVENHRYYESYTYTGMEKAMHYWVDLNASENVVTSEVLSASYRRATAVNLTFDFPFYGHMLRKIILVTGGFISTSDLESTSLAATQYIAPLMANFDTSLSTSSNVRYADNGTSLTVEWNNVMLRDHANAGAFTFQVTIHKTGDIVFVYKELPMAISEIGDEQHPVKVGLSDAYITEKTVFYVNRKTVYEYHKIDMTKNYTIGNWTAIVFKALPTCVSLTSCEECLSEAVSFNCQWCNTIGRCSDGVDKHRPQWFNNSCDLSGFQNIDACPVSADKDDTGGTSVGEVNAVICLLALLLSRVAWIA